MKKRLMAAVVAAVMGMCMAAPQALAQTQTKPASRASVAAARTERRQERKRVRESREDTAELAASIVTEGLFQFDMETGTLLSCDRLAAGNIVIPEKIGGVQVTAIGENAFLECGNISSVTIPSGVTTIGKLAFEHCEMMTGYAVAAGNTSFSVDARGVLFNYDKTQLLNYPPAHYASTYAIPSSVMEIGDSAFEECYNLVEIEISDSVTEIGSWAFSNCDAFAEVRIPASVTVIGEWAFNSCSGLESFTVDAANPAYSSDACGVLFDKNKTRLIRYPAANTEEMYEIPNGVTVIEKGAFEDSVGLMSVTIPNSVTEISGWAFSGCYRIESMEIPASVTQIGDWAFEYCDMIASFTVDAANANYTSDARGVLFSKDMTTLLCYPSLSWEESTYEIPNTVKVIAPSAFERCWSLMDITIPNGVTDIGAYAFNECSNLTSMHIPASVTQIEAQAFHACSSLGSFTVDEGNPSYSADANGALLSNAQTCLIAYPAGRQAATYEVPSTVTMIASAAFQQCWMLTDVTLPSGLASIGKGAFHYCSNLTSITIPSSVVNIRDEAFSGCESLESITVEAGNSYYSSDANGVLYDRNKTRLIQYPAGNSASTYTIPDGVAIISHAAFETGWNLTEIVLPDSVTVIEPHAFFGCSTLKTLTIPSGVVVIGKSAFSSCRELTVMNLPTSVEAIGTNAFEYCEQMVTFSVEAGNPNYSSDARGALFNKDQTYLIAYPLANTATDYEVPSGVTTIAMNTFNGCYALRSVKLPLSLTTISMGAFSWCSDLVDVYYVGTEAQWNEIFIDENNYDLTAAILHCAGKSVNESRWANLSFSEIMEDAQTGNVTARVAIENVTRAELTGTIYVAMYDSDGRMMDMAEQAITLPGRYYQELDIPLDCAIEGGIVIKAFFWSDTMRPRAQVCALTTPNV